MVIVITQLHTTFMVLLAIVPFFMIPVFADVEVEGVSGFYGHDDAYNVIGVVKNSDNYSALAAVTIQLEYGNTVVETTVYRFCPPTSITREHNQSCNSCWPTYGSWRDSNLALFCKRSTQQKRI